MPDKSITHGVIAGVIECPFYIQESTQGYLLLVKHLLNPYNELMFLPRPNFVI
jgi:hypothetical protein